MGGGKQVQTPDGDDVDLVVPDGVHAGDAFEVVIGLETDEEEDEEEDEEQSEDADEEPEAEEVGDGSGSGSRPSRLQYEAAGSEGVGSGSDEEEELFVGDGAGRGLFTTPFSAELPKFDSWRSEADRIREQREEMEMQEAHERVGRCTVRMAAYCPYGGISVSCCRQG